MIFTEHIYGILLILSFTVAWFFYFKIIFRRNYKTDFYVDKLFKLFIKRSKDLKLKNIENSEGRIVLEVDNVQLKFWNRNKYYAWASEGELTINNHVIYEWNNKMPSRRTMKKMINIVNSLTYEHTQKIKIEKQLLDQEAIKKLVEFLEDK